MILINFSLDINLGERASLRISLSPAHRRHFESLVFLGLLADFIESEDIRKGWRTWTAEGITLDHVP